MMRKATLAIAVATLFCTSCRTTPAGAESTELEEVVAERATPWLKMEAEKRISRQEKLEVMSRVARAFDYALVVNGWSDPEAICEQKLTVRVRKARDNDSSAFAHNLALFEVELASNDGARLDGDLAHELAHVQDLRALKEAEPSVIPRYLHEGKALYIGRRYRGKVGEPTEDKARAKIISQLRPEEARQALKDWSGKTVSSAAREKKALSRNLAVSLFYVEYLRTKLVRDRADVLRLIGHIFEKVGEGEAYEARFFDAFGVLPAEAEEGFISFLKATEEKPHERLRGTIWAKLADEKR